MLTGRRDDDRPEGLGGRARTVDAPGRLPNLVIIGAMRSATSYLASKLRAHPDIFMSPMKELHYFNRWYDRSLDWYMANFAGATKERVVGEATPEYMYSEGAISRMADAIPEVKLIASLRNPVDRAYSHWLKERAWGWESLEFGEAIAIEPARLANATEVQRDFYAYLDKGRYLPQLQRVSRLYPRTALHVVIFEDLRADPDRVFRGIFEFLDVDPSYIPPDLTTRVGSHKILRSRRFHGALSRLPRSSLRRTLEKINTRGSEPPPMDPVLRARLLEGYAEHNAALAAWLGQDLSVWDR